MTWPELAFSAAVVVATFVFASRRTKKLAVSKPAPVPAVVTPSPPPAPPNEPLSSTLQRLSDTLAPLAEKTAHPQELADLPEFKAVVDAFLRPDVTLDVLHRYACGANWPLSCAALLALCRHPQRNSLLTTILGQLGNIRPWGVYFALKYVCASDPRPPVGAPIKVAPPWWPQNPVIGDLFREYLAAREALGDEPSFGGQLGVPPCAPPDQIAAILQEIDHPYAGRLSSELRHWHELQLDRPFLTSFGRFWPAGAAHPLLVEPEAWRAGLDQAESAVGHDPPRSILVTGDPRVGKSSFLSLLGERLGRAGWTVFEAGGAELQAGQKHVGELEERIRRLVEQLDIRKHVAWYAGDLLQIAISGTHSGQSASILDQVLPAVASGRLLLLSEAGSAAASRLFQVRPSLRSLIEVCRLEPMGEADTAALIEKMAPLIDSHMGIRIGADALSATLELTQQYLGTGQLPGSVIELLTRAAGATAFSGERELKPDGVLAALSQMTGLPRTILDDQQRIELTSIKQFFAAHVIGQDEAIAAVVDRIAMLKAGLVDPRRPVAVFLFAGPTGTGKTELAKTLAEFLFSSPDRMSRLDMSEFQTAEATAKILGQRDDVHPDDTLVERIRRQPFSVVLLDEFEKAHPNTWDLFLQIFDDGRLTDANGRVADFRHAFIVLTSNLGATAHHSSGAGFVPASSQYSEDQVMRAVSQTFRPEFVNRIDKVVVFKPLSRDLMRMILRKELNGLLERRGLRRRDWAVEWEASAIEFLLDRGFSPEMGARPLKRAIDQHVLAPLAATLVEHRFPGGDQFLFVRSDGKSIEVEFVDPDAESNSPAPTPSPDPEPVEAASLAAMIMRPRGSTKEQAALTRCCAEVETELASEHWTQLKDQLDAESADPEFWQRPDRHVVLGRRALLDRVEEAARTVAHLKLRLDRRGTRPAQASRELVARLAQQLHLVQQGIADSLQGWPIDVLLMVEMALDGSADQRTDADWCGRITDMYRQWARRRHMQLQEFAPPKARVPLILQVSGFGAYRTLVAEAGLHIFEDARGEEAGRTVARVKAAPGPLAEPTPRNAYREFTRLLGDSAGSSALVRRYRDGPAPLVRDVKTGWRSGRLDAVLRGDFDLIGLLQHQAD